jgi:hypothetical protein
MTNIAYKGDRKVRIIHTTPEGGDAEAHFAPRKDVGFVDVLWSLRVRMSH